MTRPSREEEIVRHRICGIVHAQIILAQINEIATYGVGLGSVLAIVCSWQRNHSILWAILAGILSRIYVIYFAATRKPNEVL